MVPRACCHTAVLHLQAKGAALSQQRLCTAGELLCAKAQRSILLLQTRALCSHLRCALRIRRVFRALALQIRLDTKRCLSSWPYM